MHSPLCSFQALALAVLLTSVQAFAPAGGRSTGCFPATKTTTALAAEKGGDIFQGFKNFFAELDAFLDDASAR
jgi:hypothetical protein